MTSTEKSKGKRWVEFHTQNPHVYDLLTDYCRQWRDAGHSSFGVRAPWERMRWQLGVKTDAADFKLNDHYCPFYARLIALCEPDLATLLEMRKADEADEVVADYYSRIRYDEHQLPGDGGLFGVPNPRDPR